MEKENSAQSYKPFREFIFCISISILGLLVSSYVMHSNGYSTFWVIIFIFSIAGLITANEVKNEKSDSIIAKTNPTHPFTDLTSSKPTAKEWSETNDLCLECGHQIQLGKNFCKNCGNASSDKIAINCTQREIVFNNTWIYQLRTEGNLLFYGWWDTLADDVIWLSEASYLEKHANDGVVSELPPEPIKEEE